MVVSVPDTGDIVWLNFTPQAGREQAGKRPALVLSPESYNKKSGLMIACPITSRAKGYPFEVPLPASGSVKGVVLADHVKSIDWQERGATLVEKADDATLENVRAMIAALVGIDS